MLYSTCYCLSLVDILTSFVCVILKLNIQVLPENIDYLLISFAFIRIDYSKKARKITIGGSFY